MKKPLYRILKIMAIVAILCHLSVNWLKAHRRTAATPVLEDLRMIDNAPVTAPQGGH